MTKNPFKGSRGVNDIIGPDSSPRRDNLSARLMILVSASSKKPFSLILVLMLALSSQLAGCAPPRPIAPARATNSDAATVRQTFTSNQHARLDHLRAALAGPPPTAAVTGLTIRLAFDEAADLDLFVTDPAQESVYFANSPTRSGGTLNVDRRCDNPSPRIEAVSYSNPKPGRYRVGVDFHRVCPKSGLSDKEAAQGLYRVRVDEGTHVIVREGMVIPGQFEVIVLEFDVE